MKKLVSILLLLPLFSSAQNYIRTQHGSVIWLVNINGLDSVLLPSYNQTGFSLITTTNQLATNLSFKTDSLATVLAQRTIDTAAALQGRVNNTAAALAQKVTDTAAYNRAFTQSRLNDTAAAIRAAIPLVGGAAAWGAITGVLSEQTDLNTSLGLKLSTATAASTYQPIGSYAAASHVHAYNTLTGLPTLFDGNYNSLTNKPTLFTQTNADALYSVLAHTHTGVYQPVGSYLVAADIAGKQNNITLTTTGSGAATFVSNTLNIPTPAGGSSPTLILLAANFSNSTITQLPVTGWTIPVLIGKTYRIEINAAYQTAATGTGGTLGYYMTSGSGTIRGFIQGGISQSAVATSLEIPVRTVTTIGAAGSSLTTTAVSVINSPHSFYSVTSFTCTASGNLQIGFASEVAASASQLNQNSSLIYQALN